MGTNKALALPGYQVMQLLGNGARSTIWQIRENSTGDVLALKRVVKRESSDARFLAQAVNEYDIASQLDHPALRKIYRIRRLRRWMSVREVHLIMEFCDGVTLQNKRPEDIDEIVRIFYEVAGALAHMNAEGFVHADMKPNNVIISPKGEVKIIDMGQSCPIGTIKERIQGTPDF
ncbi:MAG: protein kinase, partial [Planctomycetes bacterium]|nr:protein kinase [Planctomycetota bacterium]